MKIFVYISMIIVILVFFGSISYYFAFNLIEKEYYTKEIFKELYLLPSKEEEMFHSFAFNFFELFTLKHIAEKQYFNAIATCFFWNSYTSQNQIKFFNILYFMRIALFRIKKEHPSVSSLRDFLGKEHINKNQLLAKMKDALHSSFIRTIDIEKEINDFLRKIKCSESITSRTFLDSLIVCMDRFAKGWMDEAVSFIRAGSSLRRFFTNIINYEALMPGSPVYIETGLYPVNPQTQAVVRKMRRRLLADGYVEGSVEFEFRGKAVS